jgi:ferredoxin-type protein NapH
MNTPLRSRWKWERATVRLFVQALVVAGFLAHGFAYYLLKFRPFGNLLPFSAYQSLGAQVVSSALVMWSVFFVLTLLFGRVVCGWLCPFGFFQDIGERILRRLKIRLPEPKPQSRLVRLALLVMVLGHFVATPLLASSVHFWRTDLRFQEPWLLGFPFHPLLFVADLVLVFLVLTFAVPMILGPRAYCRAVCETGYLLERAAEASFGRIRRDERFDRDTCITCRKCVSACPQGIDVLREVHEFDRVVSPDCIVCMSCADGCPPKTLVYSLKKRVVDTGQVAGYLARKQASLSDVPRMASTGIGAVAFGFIGFRVLPASYFHTYLMLASLGAILGHMAWRWVIAPLLGESLGSMARTQAEREDRDGLSMLSNRDKMRLLPGEERSRWIRRVTVVGLLLGAVTVAAALWVLPPRIAHLDEIAHTSLAQRRSDARVYFGVPPELSSGELEDAFARLGPHLTSKLGVDVRLVTASSYGALAHSLERGDLDAALLPPQAYSSLVRRAGPSFSASLRALRDGRPRSDAMIVVRADGPRALGELRGKAVAFTSLDSLSGFAAPMAMLERAGLQGEDLAERVMAQTHSRALDLLMTSHVDAACTFDGAFEQARRAHPEVPLRVLAAWPDLPTDVVVVHPEVEPGLRQRLARALVDLDDATVLSRLRRAGITSFEPATGDELRSLGAFPR